MEAAYKRSFPRFARTAAFGLTLGLVLAPVLLVAAMVCFPAGHAGVAGGYSFSRHVVSDLGRTVLSNGTPNPVARALFVAAMAVSALGTGIFWVGRGWLLEHPAARGAVWICGLAMSACLTGIGLTPLDRAESVHDPITAGAAYTAAGAVLALALEPRDRLERIGAKRVWLAILLPLGIGWAILVALHHAHRLAFRPWLPLGQKTLIAAFIGWLVYQNARLWRAPAAAGTSPRTARDRVPDRAV